VKSWYYAPVLSTCALVPCLKFNKNMSEATYTATWIAPGFEVLKNKGPDIFTNSWCEMIHPSSK
ncbi:9716_t:CDS:2, partial [Entrophospora sp. SA101]